MDVFIAGGTGYMGQRLIGALLARGHRVAAVARTGSERKLPAGCLAVPGDVLNGDTYSDAVAGHDTFIQLVGVAHPSPAKAAEFVAIDQRSALEAVRVARPSGVKHFVYVSVAQPAPAMHAYVAVRALCEAAIREAFAGTGATILRPWYVLGPGHQWPRLLIPFYWLAERLPATREGAQRLGLVTLSQMIAALVHAVEHPANGIDVVDVPRIKQFPPYL